MRRVVRQVWQGVVVVGLVAVTIVGCKKAAPRPEPRPEKPDLSLLAALPAVDLVGYLSGRYGTGGNNPAIYADVDGKLFVMMGKRGTAELPLDRPDEAIAAFEQFLVLHGYPANGKQPSDDRTRVVIDGKEMVVMTSAELFPTMPDEQKARFTQPQLDLLYRTAPGNGYAMLAARYPLIWAYSSSLSVQGPGFAQDFPIASASDAFAAYRKLVVK